MTRPLVFVSLAMNQTRFYAGLDRLLSPQGWQVVHLCYHERSVDWLARQGLRAVNAYRHPAARQPIDPRSVVDRPLEDLLLHEETAFELPARRRPQLARNFGRYLAVADAVLAEIEGSFGTKATLVQELGGLGCMLAAYYAARARGTDAYFVEPSFFRGRVFFTRNTLGAPRVAGEPSSEPGAELRSYLADAVASGSPVVPLKDNRHYRTPARKLSDPYNARRLIEKLVDKHILRKREAFSHIGLHVRRHLRMAVNERRLAKVAVPPPEAGYVYYPLHVPTDVALTLRAPALLDQYALIDRLASMLPQGRLLAIKEHPARVGALDHRRIAGLLRRHANLRFLQPRTNNFAVMRRAGAVVAVNSKAGAEALLLRRPVVALGDGFYRDSPLARTVRSLEELPGVLTELLAPTWAPPGAAAVDRYFQSVWERSRPGEIYAADPAGVALFAQSLLAVLNERDREPR